MARIAIGPFVRFGSTRQVRRRRTLALISAPRSGCTRVTLRDPKSVASITQDENHRCGSIGPGRDPSNSDTTRRQRGASRCKEMCQWCMCRSTTRALRTLRALPRRCLTPNHPRRTVSDRLSSDAPTCFRAHRRRVDPRHAGPMDGGVHQTPRVLRRTRVATCQPSWAGNLHSHPQIILENSEVAARNFSTPQSAGTRRWFRVL